MHPADLHLTLAFLGEMAPVTRIVDVITPVARDVTGFSLALDAPGWFPRGGIAWVGPAARPPGLKALRHALLLALMMIGFTAERRAFCPHVTLARRADGPPRTPALRPWPVQQFGLFERVTPVVAGAPRYRCIKAFPLCPPTG